MLFRVWQPADLGTLPADRQIESRMGADKQGWIHGYNLSPYVIEIQNETGQAETIALPFSPYQHPLYVRTEKLIFHALVSIGAGAAPIPAANWAVYGEVSEFKPSSVGILGSASSGAGTVLNGLTTGLITNMNVGNAAVALPAVASATRKTVHIWNPAASGQTLYVGYANTVTAGAPTNGGAQGVPVAPGTALTFSVAAAQQLFGILSVAGPIVVQVEELG